ncbi:calcium activated potassium channel subunit [Echinococcus multilocularis]|uniref:Calcium activated potassium channel subunit n=1 Tax=Echinococcus multilocularis TaxID=6211 RepID=A0A068Y0R2_ECHMU|nr:calcium activated potassium channel subunit [Echinococcus multilocularis]
MALPIRRLIRAHGNSTFRRAAYIFCATLLTCSLLTGIIIFYLVVVPYLHEHGFEESLCHLAKIEPYTPILKCENRCSRERSFFPCLRVSVVFQRNNINFSATLFDTIETHEHYRTYKCVTHSCQKRLEENTFAIHVFRWRLIRQPVFRCFVAFAVHGNEALMYKYHRPSSVTYGMFLPALCCFIAILSLLALWHFDRCRVWHLEDETAFGLVESRTFNQESI